MCLNWITMPDGNMHPCHMCWQCKRDRINDWVGRCIAESEVSAHCLRVTLTYGKDAQYNCDHPHAYDLHYDDVQLYLKRLRRNTAGKVRFFCAGEYGSAKGRAHWHLIMFFKGSLSPGIVFEWRYKHEYWPHGWSFWEMADPEKMRYAVKYIMKDDREGHERVHRFSVRPEIGHEYFVREALRAANQGVPPRDTYRFPQDWDRHGRPREYRLTRAALYKYLANYARFWRDLYGDENWPESELMWAFVDERARRERRLAGEADYSDVDFVRRFQLENAEKRLKWALVPNENQMSGRLYPNRSDEYQKQSRGS